MMNDFQPRIQNKGATQAHGIPAGFHATPSLKQARLDPAQGVLALVERYADEQKLRHPRIRRRLFADRIGSPTAAPTSSVPMRHINASQAKGIYEAYVKTCQRWGLDSKQQSVLLGYPRESTAAQIILHGLHTPQHLDAEDRAMYIVGISLELGVLFDEDVGAEIDWLRQPRTRLGSTSPLDHMLEGRMINLLGIVEMVRRERGL